MPFLGRCRAGSPGSTSSSCCRATSSARSSCTICRAGRFSLGEFYRRRIQRLLPNAVLTVLVTVVLAALVLTPFTSVAVAKHALLTLINLSNVYVWTRVGGYWGDAAASMPLLHTWSLSVEEQFYLLFPALFVRIAPLRRARHLLVGLTAASLIVSVVATGRDPIAAFYLLPTRAWELLLGAALALWRMPGDTPSDSRGRFIRQAAGWVGLALIALGFFVIREGRHFPGTIALIPTLGSFGVLIAIADQDGLLARNLSAPAAVRIGKVSYSLYLWHWPLVVIGRTYAELTNRSPLAGQLMGVLASVPIAVLVYRHVERPLRERGPGRTRRLATIGVGFLGAVAACLVLSTRHPLADPGHRFDAVTFSGLRYNVGDNDAATATEGMRIADVGRPGRTEGAPDVWRTGGLIHDWGPGTPRVVLFGSSHALMYAALIDDICRTLRLPVAFLCADGSSVFFPTGASQSFPTDDLARDFDAARLRWLADWKPDVLIVVDRWDRYPTTLNAQLRELLRAVGPSARHVILSSQVPVLRVGQSANLRDYVSWRMRSAPTLPVIPPDGLESVRQASLATIAAIAREQPSVELLRVDQPFYEDDGSVRYVDGRSFLYADADHLSDAGTARVSDIWLRAIAAASSR